MGYDDCNSVAIAAEVRSIEDICIAVGIVLFTLVFSVYDEFVQQYDSDEIEKSGISYFYYKLH